VKAILLILSSCMLAGAALADTVADLQAREQAWVDALMESDLAAFDEIMHPAFRLFRTQPEDVAIDKQAYLQMSGMNVSCAEITSFDAEIIAGDVAVVQLTMSLDWQQEGRGPLPPHFELIDTWRRQEDGVWRVLSRISQPAHAPPSGMTSKCAGPARTDG